MRLRANRRWRCNRLSGLSKRKLAKSIIFGRKSK
jgi:hypothetical protein